MLIGFAFADGTGFGIRHSDTGAGDDSAGGVFYSADDGAVENLGLHGAGGEDQGAAMAVSFNVISLLWRVNDCRVVPGLILDEWGRK